METWLCARLLHIALGVLSQVNMQTGSWAQNMELQAYYERKQRFGDVQLPSKSPF